MATCSVTQAFGPLRAPLWEPQSGKGRPGVNAATTECVNHLRHELDDFLTVRVHQQMNFCARGIQQARRFNIGWKQRLFRLGLKDLSIRCSKRPTYGYFYFAP